MADHYDQVQHIRSDMLLVRGHDRALFEHAHVQTHVV